MIAGPADGIIEALLRSEGTMADTVTEMPCREIAAALSQVGAILDGAGVTPADCLAFPCGNDLPSAIVLLALLAGGWNFILLPHAEASPGQSPDAALPEIFCRYHLQIRSVAHARGAPASSLANAAITIAENPGWHENLPAGPACFFVPTSGSTGRAKLVRHRHERLLPAARHCAERLRLLPSDRVALPVPIIHMFGLGAALLPALLAGASIDLQPNANALRFLARERQFCPTVAFLIPSFGEALVRLRKSPRPYRLTVMAGDRLTPDLFDRYERLHGCLVNLYGSSELGVIAAGDPTDPPSLRRNVIGRLMPGAAVRQAPGQSRAEQDGAERDAGDVLWLQHEYGFESYAGADGLPLREPDGSIASGASFRSNDVGQVIDGYLDVRGRGDDLVNRDGRLVSCDEIAAALRAMAGIGDCVVLAGAMARRGRALIAFCVPVANTQWDTASLRKTCLQSLPPRAIPDMVVVLPDLPRLPSGKVDRMALRRHHMPDEKREDADIR